MATKLKPTDFRGREEGVNIQKRRPTGGRAKWLGHGLSTILAPFARRFIAGTTLSKALETVAKLKEQGFQTTVDHLGESVTNPSEATTAAEQYVVILKALKERGLTRNISVKLTQIGLAIDHQLCRRNLERIVQTAEEMGGFVRVDMEGSDVTQATLDVISEVKTNRRTPVGAVLQVMLKRTPADLVDLLENDTTIRLCKGAYKEPPDIAYQDMREIRHEFVALAKRLITSGAYHGIATHDKKLIQQIADFARAHKIGPESFEFQMLLGVRKSLQRHLIAEGWRVRIYVPFGRAWFPYTWRRLRERKENVWFVIKSLFQR